MKKYNDYDKFAKKRQADILSGVMKSHFLVEKPAIEKLLPSLKEKKVLMLGCGTGDESIILANHGAEKLVGIDISKASVDIAKETYPNCEFQVGNMEKLDFDKSSFDFVYSSLAVDYTDDPSAVYKEVFRALKSGGSFLFSLPHPIRWSSEEKIVDGKPTKIIGFSARSDTPGTYGSYMDYKKNKHSFEKDNSLEFWTGPPSMHFGLLKKAGFMVDNFIETRAIEEGKKIDKIYYDKFSKLPQFVIFLATKP